MEDIPALLVLLRSGAGAASLRLLLETRESPGAALDAGPVAWRSAGISPGASAALQAPDRRLLQSDLAWLQSSSRHHLIGWHSSDYPSLLRSGMHPPAALFVAGDPDLLWHPQVAVVGSRRPSAGGRENARQFARAFGRAGLAVTSGLASGVDTAAHLGAMETSRTLAVLGTGPDQCYPPGNADLLARIVDTGAVVTEHPPGTAGLRQHFPSRNRLVAGLSLATVVIEAALRSGALITARLAAESGREVFALPGSIHNPMARGCHRLIREGVGLAETPEEVIQALATLAENLAGDLRNRLRDASAPVPCASGPRPQQRGLFAGPGGALVAGEEDRVFAAIGHDPVNLDQLSQRTGLTVGPLSAMLLAMELNGKISAAHGRYSRRS
ncbi:MAG: DNA-protecting protein DprA [Frankiaceae bacterium]|nr:DNA-protecting protein DprA [Arenimonas sp.]